MNGISIFLVNSPTQQDQGEERKSRLVEALKRKREEEKHLQMMMKMDEISQGVGTLPRVGHVGGG